nr:GntR family transcriptional regulator [Anaerolineae bacterium]
MFIERNGDIPLFKQLKNILTRQIQDGEYTPGDLLPSETELIDQYSLSRTTVRRAIQSLVQESFAYTVHGKGTFVAETGLTQYLNNLTSFSQGVQERNMVPSRRILSLDRVQPDKHLATQLRIPPSETVIYLVRLLFADGEPVSLGKTYISLSSIAPYQDSITRVRLEECGLYTLLEEMGIQLSGGEQVVSAAAATSEQANLLDVEPDSPLLFSERISFKQGRIPVEFTEMWSRADKTRWRIALGPYPS